MNIKTLQNIGLTQGEIKVYLALLKIGENSTGKITKESQVSRSKLYVILDKLSKKGLVSHILKGKISYFKAMEPKRILDYMDEKSTEFSKKRKEIEGLIQSFEKQNNPCKTEATLYTGIKAVKNFYKNILDELHSGDEYYVLGATYGEDRPGVKEFFENYHNQRAKNKIKVRMLANYNIKEQLVKSTYLNAEIKFLPQYLLSNMIVVFYKDKSFIFFLSEEPVGFLMRNKEIAEGFKSYFDTFWKLAKK
jgi:sugar-specific transcriptional regulator TrmB